MAGQLRRLLDDGTRGFAAGLAGTAAMTTTLKLEQLLRDRTSHEGTVHTGGPTDDPVDYDASEHVVTAAAAVLRHRPQTKRGARALYLLVHWGYGSAVGIAYLALLHEERRNRTPSGARIRAATMFYLLCQAMAMTLFPTVGGTPPPWRWHRRILISSLVQHAVYAVAVAEADKAIEIRGVPADEALGLPRVG